jgi:hypothetical protein
LTATGGFAGLQRANHFHKHHHRHRIHEVHPHKALGALGHSGQRGHGNRRRVAGDNHVGSQQPIGFSQHGALDLQLLRHGFH